MPVGFGNTTQTADQFIQNWFKKPTQGLTRGSDVSTTVSRLRNDWQDKYMLRAVNGEYDCELDELLHPERDQPHLKVPNVVASAQTRTKRLINGRAGLWGVDLSIDTCDHYSDHYDFTISVNHGGTMRFNPGSIEFATKKQHGQDAYQKWKSLVLDDLDSLRFLVQKVRERINRPHVSVTCSDRSATLCKRVGIPVKQGIAFLLPIRYQ